MRPEELAARADEVQIVDVREADEWEAGGIETAVHIPAGDLVDRFDHLDRERPVVAVCRTGSRSGEAARELEADGFDAQNLERGIMAWLAAGFPITTPDGRPGAVVEHSSDDDSSAGEQEFQAELIGLGMEIDEHFGGRRASDDEIRAYLRDRMIGEGRSPEQADAILDRIESGEAPRAD